MVPLFESAASPVLDYHNGPPHDATLLPRPGAGVMVTGDPGSVVGESFAFAESVEVRVYVATKSGTDSVALHRT